MSLQIELEKSLRRFNFLESTPYEKHDLTNAIKAEDRVVVRQGDLVVTNYWIDNCRKRGLRTIHLYGKSRIHRLMDSHVVIPLESQTILLHPEHGVTVIPMTVEKLNFYTFIEGGD
jgi:hypothetical protein